MLLCVGSFFGPGNLGWQDYKTGRCRVPIPVYILGKEILNPGVLRTPVLNGLVIAYPIYYRVTLDPLELIDLI